MKHAWEENISGEILEEELDGRPLARGRPPVDPLRLSTAWIPSFLPWSTKQRVSVSFLPETAFRSEEAQGSLIEFACLLSSDTS